MQFGNCKLPPSSPPTLPKKCVDPKKLMSHKTPSANAIKNGMKKHLKHPTTSMKNCVKAIPQVTAAVEFLMAMLPERMKKTALFNPGGKSSLGHQQWKAHQKFFPPGTLGFAFPRHDQSKPPDQDCLLMEAKTTHILQWEMNLPDLESMCPICGSLSMHVRHNFVKEGVVTPVQDVSGVILHAVLMQCKCANLCTCIT